MTAATPTRRRLRQKAPYSTASRRTNLRLPATLYARLAASSQAAGNGNVSAVIGYILAHHYGDAEQEARYLTALNGVAPL